MKHFERIESIITPLPRINIDTDQIIPKQFLKLVKRTGFGEYLFYGWRQDNKTRKIDSFPFDNPKYTDSHILVTGDNFGCGSSREHAVWALRDYGFKAIIAPSFADIFASNCIKNGILPVTLEQDAVNILVGTDSKVTIDLELKRISVADYDKSWNFEISPYAQKILLEGLDEIDYTLGFTNKISAFESKQLGASA